MNDKVKDLIFGFGSLAEMAALVRDSWIKAGFTRAEAVHMAELHTLEMLRNAMTQNKKEGSNDN